VQDVVDRELLIQAIRTRLNRVRSRMRAAAQRAGREPASVRLVVVTKAHPLEVAQAAVMAGAKRLGENYVEEAIEKMRGLDRSGFDHSGVEWHMIGHVQSRKARLVASESFKLVHSLDRLKLARRLNRFAETSGRRLPVLLECNVSGEESKFGWPAWQEDQWEHLLAPVEEVLSLPHLEVRGLMTVPPFLPAEQVRPFFRRLRRLRDFLAARFPHADWSELSMGMSADFETAIEEGATLIRVGTAILGPRPQR